MEYNRHRMVYFILRPFFKLFLRLRYNFTAEKYPGSKGPFLILPNHNCTLDPIMVAMSFRTPIYFVTSDHLLRLGFLSKVIDFLVAPIGKLKASSDLVTIKKIMKKLKRGRTVCIFPEGNRSFHGCTTYISPAIGKLIKTINVDVLLYNIDRRYLADPRWGNTIRRGKLRGFVKRTLRPEEYKAMTPEEITDVVVEALDVNPTPLDPPNVIPFKGKRLAESLERAVFICPHCKSVASIHTKGNEGTCEVCGLTFQYEKTGYLSGKGFPFRTVKEWDDWQRKAIQGTDYEDGRPICSDKNETMYLITRARRNDIVGSGILTVYPDCFLFESESDGKLYRFDYECVNAGIIHGRQVLQLCYDENQYYEFKNNGIRSAVKYMYYYYYFKEKARGEISEFFGI